MTEKSLSFTYLKDKKILIAHVNESVLDKDKADAVFAISEKELPSQPEHEGFILDVVKVREVSDPALGILMKSMGLVKKAKNYMILVISEDLLQDVMVRHPVLFDYYAVFPSIDEAVVFIDKNR
ncbi:MAG: hypothetical protein CVV44_09500 [Spirochaetae bacterium HGW-Spirochaetae-1]|jgi:hypothetical protein|nr:MAG: hypothetical protein CVV44_09500 [Spirochaetae bacterium HGW-Spirochaetae-1]